MASIARGVVHERSLAPGGKQVIADLRPPSCSHLGTSQALAGLFCFQGNAQFVASGNLSVPVFLLAYQLKVRSARRTCFGGARLTEHYVDTGRFRRQRCSPFTYSTAS